MIDSNAAQALFKASRACESDMAAGIAQNVAVGRILEERDAYRQAAMRAECARRDAACGCGGGCPAQARYCADVESEIDASASPAAAAEIADMLEELGGWPPKRKRPVSKPETR